jgi:hypothetical protein
MKFLMTVIEDVTGLIGNLNPCFHGGGYHHLILT